MHSLYSIYSQQRPVGLVYREYNSTNPGLYIYKVEPHQSACKVLDKLLKVDTDTSDILTTLQYQGTNLTDAQSDFLYNLYPAIQEFSQHNRDSETEYVTYLLVQYMLSVPETPNYSVRDLLAVYTHLMYETEYPVQKFTYYIRNLYTLNYLFAELNLASARFDLNAVYSGVEDYRVYLRPTTGISNLIFSKAENSGVGARTLGTANVVKPESISIDLLSVLYESTFIDIPETLKGKPLLYILAVAKKCYAEETAKEFYSILKTSKGLYSQYVQTYLYRSY